MPRELRVRKTRQSYAALFDGEEEDGQQAGPSRPRHAPGNIVRGRDGAVDDDYINISDLAPPPTVVADAPAVSDDNGSEHGVEGAESTSDDNDSPMRRGMKKTQTTKTKGKAKAKDKTTTKPKEKGKLKVKEKATASSSSLKTPGPTAAPTSRQNYALPNPNIHHRHRPVPLFRGPTVASTTAACRDAARVERLVHPPLLFAPNETTPTNAYASTPSLTSRVGKAWGASIGAGPVWQIVEDLGWFQEAEKQQQQTALPAQAAQVQVMCEERMRRPRVHADLAIPEDLAWIVLNAVCVSPTPSCLFHVRSIFDDLVAAVFRDGIAYMPTAGGLTAAAAQPVSCDFGPFGEQTNVNLETLETFELCKFASRTGTLPSLIIFPFVTSSYSPVLSRKSCPRVQCRGVRIGP
jgi:transcription factor C subunit 6